MPLLPVSRLSVLLAMSALLPVSALAGMVPLAGPRVDFGYAFGHPHRITVALLDSSDKTLVDCEPGQVALSWSYDNLLGFPVANFHGPTTQWKVVLQPEVDGYRLALDLQDYDGCWSESQGGARTGWHAARLVGLVPGATSAREATGSCPTPRTGACRAGSR
jgi:hypothetical protein